MPVKAETKAEAADVMKTVDEDRRLLIQAIIVRIMKSRKVSFDNTSIPVRYQLTRTSPVDHEESTAGPRDYTTAFIALLAKGQRCQESH